MKFVRDLGIEQCVLPPLLRPDLQLLRSLGFAGDDTELIERAYQADPVLLAVCYSGSSMWTANAATVSPASDCLDGRLHFTPANLFSNLHRSLEGPATTRILRAIFSDASLFDVHDPLPASAALADEGAANHTRLGPCWDSAGLELFVYGTEYLNSSGRRPGRYPARQTLEACQAIARRHRLEPPRCLFIQQHPEAIDAGVFHNDVICVGHQNVLLCHELAFLNQREVETGLQQRYRQLFDDELILIRLSHADLPIKEAVSSYLFNSQVLTRPDGAMVLVCPSECQANSHASRSVQQILEGDNPIEQAFFIDLRQSMNNGGGPACLRLRVVLSEHEQQQLHAAIRLTDTLYTQLVDWVQRHYRDELHPDQLRDPALLAETRRAHEELGRILDLPLSD